MIRDILIIFWSLTFIVIISSCNSTKLIVKKTNGVVVEQYSVLSKDKTVKHGEYISYYYIRYGSSYQSYLKEVGWYNYGIKDSVWRTYSRPRSLRNNIENLGIKTKENYSNGKKVGVWLTYKKEVIERFDVDKEKKLSPIVRVSVKYPQRAKEDGVEGSVIVAYKTKNDCSVYDIKIIKSLSPECDAEVIRVIKRLGELSLKYGLDCDIGETVKEISFVLL